MEGGPRGSGGEEGSMCKFTVLVLLVQALGLSAVILVSVWMGHYLGGFAWTEDPARQFNYHPVFMVIGMIFLYADGECILFKQWYLEPFKDDKLCIKHNLQLNYMYVLLRLWKS